MRHETRTMKTIRGDIVEYVAFIDACGECRRVQFKPFRLGNLCKWCGKRPCGCKA